MATNFDNGITVGGMPIYGLASGLIPTTTGSTFFVSSVIGSNANVDGVAAAPYATVDYAIRKCTASKGDVIIVMAGHAETVTSTSITLDVAGVTVVGLGHGEWRPTFTFGAAAATINVTAANCAWRNTRLVANFLNVATPFTVSGRSFHASNNSSMDTSSILNFLVSGVSTSSTDNAADGLVVQDNYALLLATTANAFVSILGNLKRPNISRNFVDSAATNNVGHFVTLSSKIINGARIEDNKLIVVGATTATVGIFLTGSGTTNTGIVSGNYVASLDTTSELIATAGTGLAFFNNYYTGNADASGKLWPVVDAA